jgi:hypothetical protein
VDARPGDDHGQPTAEDASQPAPVHGDDGPDPVKPDEQPAAGDAPDS